MAVQSFTRNLAVIIGINQYANNISTLQTAVNDAEMVAQHLKLNHGYEIRLLLDQAASLNKLICLLKEILPSEISSDDRVLFYFAGHGVAVNSDDGPAGYLIPQDAKQGLHETYLPMQLLHDALAALPCRHLLTILDCCFSGAFRWSSLRNILSYPEILYQERYDRFIQDPAWQVLTSAGYDQAALDVLNNNRDLSNEQRQHSPFAEAFLEALQGKADIFPAGQNGKLPGDGVITATELYLYLRDRVELTTEKNQVKRQTPGLWPLKKHGRGEYIFLVPGHQLNLTHAPELNLDNNPYRGLQSFEEEHNYLFFGRQQLVEKLEIFVLENPLTVVLGASGTGKSSLVKAGLIPKLRENIDEDWKVLPPVRPGNSPLRALARAVLDLTIEADAVVTSIETLSETLAQCPKKLVNIVAAWGKRNPNKRLLLVIDQFEELITLCQSNQEREKFLTLIRFALTIERNRGRVVITLRNDFEPQFLNSPLKSVWMKSRFLMTPMTQDELRQAIEGPAQERVLYFEPPSLVDQLINEVVQMPGALPLLSFTLSELYLKYLQRYDDNRALTQDDYESIGGVAGALTQRAAQEYECLLKQNSDYEQTMPNVMLRMVAIEGGELVRRRVLRSELIYEEAEENNRVAAVIQQLTTARLIVEGQELDGDAYIEPAHDALIRGWDKLHAWAKQSRSDIEKSAFLLWRQRLQARRFEWQNNAKDISSLLRGSVLEEAKYWITQSNVDINKAERSFIKESLLLANKERKKRNQVIGFIIGTLATGLASALFLWLRSESARHREQIAIIEASNSASQNQFLSHEYYGALASSIQAGQYLLKTRVQSDLKKKTIKQLQDITFTMQEQNRILPEVPANSVSFSPDGQIFVSGNNDGTITLWSINGTVIRIIEDSELRVNYVKFSPDGQMFASGYDDGTIKLWKTNDGSLSHVIEAHSEPVVSISFSSDGQMLVSGSFDDTVKLWNTSNYSLISTFEGHQNDVHSVSFSPNNQIIASASLDNTVKLWDITENTVTKTLEGHEDWVTAVSFSPDGQTLASASADKTIQLWDIKSGENFDTLLGHSAGVWDISFSPDGKILASASWDNTISLWRMNGQSGFKSSLVNTLGHSKGVFSLDFNSDGQTLVSLGDDGSIRLWKSNDGDFLTLVGHEAGVYSATFSPDNQIVASASRDGTIKLWDANDGSLINTLTGHASDVTHVRFSPDGKTLASASVDKTIRLWNVHNGTLIKNLEKHKSDVNSLRFSPNGKILASASDDATINLWNIIDGDLINTLTGHQDIVMDVDFSPDSKSLVSASLDDTVKLWNVGNGKLVKTFREDNDVHSVSFSPDGQMIASSSGDTADGNIKLWRTADGTLLNTLKGHDSGVGSVSFSPKGQKLVSSSADGTIRLWRSRDGALVDILSGHLVGEVFSVQFSKDGKKLVSASADATVKLWRVPDEAFETKDLQLEGLLEDACNKLEQFTLDSDEKLKQMDLVDCR
ncbi:eIF2A-related protein [Adonisia turfae]|uniref:Uncharacterized protein n=1 Tax=Adonisia turfae CCMR0081 TaxID=2292702 RepID=A0A6M0RGK5_9CYAN|nr:caspase family protein [Adonisia turfae]NEZ55386.1 hypothetical protein [Adonisia turfae CCMR0081]